MDLPLQIGDAAGSDGKRLPAVVACLIEEIEVGFLAGRARTSHCRGCTICRELAAEKLRIVRGYALPGARQEDAADVASVNGARTFSY